MNVEKSKPNPWAGGDEREQELGPDEVQRIRERVATEQKDKQQPKSLDAIVLPGYREDLIDAGGVYTQTYRMDEEGRIDDPDVHTGPAGPDLLSCASAGVKRVEGGLAYWFMADDLRIAAVEINKKYPDIIFTFGEDRNKRTLTYTATLKEGKSST